MADTKLDKLNESNKPNKYFITTAIAYPNGKPHMGHALEIIQADAFARFYRILGKDVEFQTGTDEHGIKNWRTAKEKGKDIKEFLDKNVEVFKQLYSLLNISYNSFLRTSDKTKHYPGASKLWKKLVESGDIYKQKYKGLYCVGCESYKTEKELIDGKCPNHPTKEIEIIEEENYFFRLSKYKDKVFEIIKNDGYKVVPECRKNEILSFLKDAKDISFSRSKEALPWGVPVPEDEDHVMYVWCDALSNYITGQGYGWDEKRFLSTWPADIHVIGKDILRFHAAFWPAMLLSAGVDLPKELFVHGFLNMSGQKMGKSTGNVVDPFNQIESYGVDPFRYYILCSMPIDGDGDYNEDVMIERINSEIVGNISNFCYRVLSFTAKNTNSRIKGISEEHIIIKELEKKHDEYKQAFKERDIRKAIAIISEISAIGNRFFQEREPWKNKDTAEETLSVCVNIAKNLSILLSPIMPDYASKLQKQLNVIDFTWGDIGFEMNDHKIGEPEIVFRKFEKMQGDIIAKEKMTQNNTDSQDNKKLFPADLRTAKVIDAKLHPDSDKLIILDIDIGEENKRQLVAGLQKYYSPEQLIGENIIVVSNLKPAKLGGELSQGMLLAASLKTKDEEKVVVLNSGNTKPGQKVICDGFESKSTKIKIDEFFENNMKTKDGKVYVEGFDSFLKLVESDDSKADEKVGKDDNYITVDVPDGYDIG